MNKPASILCAVILLVGATIAEAQQPGKIFRIGFLDPTNASGMAGKFGGIPPRAQQFRMDRGEKYRF